ncbi:M1 family metallopeptidase [Melioribacteraceae bacterium 4301-Me]|uniref:M1 family metallopeptidase n=1 Tax=Pyranulibacter aquaticus TaxID=3163344 RepID=UPI00359A4D00
MKTAASIFLLIILTTLFYLQENGISFLTQHQKPIGNYYKGLLKNELKNYTKTADYDIKVNFNPSTKIIDVNEKITWINRSSLPVSELQFHFYANAYKSKRTLFASGWNIQPENETHIDLRNFMINEKKAKLFYFQPEIYNPYDSTVAKSILSKPIYPGDSVNIYFNYSMKIPKSIKRLGYASGRNFYFISQWYPKLGVFEDGKWVCSQYHPYTNFYSDFADYNVSITVPKNFVVGATGNLSYSNETDNKITYVYQQAAVHDFAWFTTDNILYRDQIYRRNDRSEILIKAFVQPEREKYFDRYFKVIKNCLRYFEDNIGVYPYENITIVDVPRTCAAGGMEYPTLFTTSAELFSPVETHQPEYVTAHEFSHQFFYGLLANNEVYEAWLDEGFATYISTKIVYNYYGDELAFFKIASFIPVFGLNLLSYKGIPIIYTLAKIPKQESSEQLKGYYTNIAIGTISEKSYLLPTKLSYVVNSYLKPSLVLESLERYLGHKKMMHILKKYFDKYKFKHPKAEDFINVVQENSDENMDWFFNEFYKSANTYDYLVSNLSYLGKNFYAVFVQKKGNGFFKNEVALITDKDTLYQKWDKDENYHVFIFYTKNKVKAAVIDPERKNLLDVNFANNSYTIEPNYSASLSITIRWFFWIQNALMIIGSIG